MMKKKSVKVQNVKMQCHNVATLMGNQLNFNLHGVARTPPAWLGLASFPHVV
jgi:hypothetical protein